jgi:hypothetical protein
MSTLSQELHQLYDKVDIQEYVTLYQLSGNTFYLQERLKQEVRIGLNEYQTHLLNRAMYGLDVFTAHQVKRMNKHKKIRITAKYEDTKEVLILWKHEIITKLSNAIFGITTGACDFLPLLEETDTYHVEDRGYLMSLTTLGIKEHQIVEKLINCRILPENFYELTGSDHQKLNYHGSTNSN